jgi:hypothetical protein
MQKSQPNPFLVRSTYSLSNRYGEADLEPMLGSQSRSPITRREWASAGASDGRPQGNRFLPAFSQSRFATRTGSDVVPSGSSGSTDPDALMYLAAAAMLVGIIYVM